MNINVSRLFLRIFYVARKLKTNEQWELVMSGHIPQN